MAIELSNKPRITFKCLSCGICCTLSPITILPHEAIILHREAARLGIKLELTEGYRIYDDVSDKNIVLSYAIKLSGNRRCPFLTRDNKCLVHNTYKPLTCRSFPYVPREIQYYIDNSTRTIMHRSVYGISTACMFVKNNAKLLEKELLEHGIAKIFPSEYKYAQEAERWRRWYMRTLTYLWRMGFVDLYSEPLEDARSVNAYVFIISKLIIARRTLTNRE